MSVSRSIMIAGILALTAARAEASPLPVFDDAQLLTQATTYLRAGVPGDPRQSVLGRHKGRRIIGDMFPGSHQSPSIRVVHYDIDPGKACQAIGGVTGHIAIPTSDMGDLQVTYCVPGILFRAHRYAYGSDWY